GHDDILGDVGLAALIRRRHHEAHRPEIPRDQRIDVVSNGEVDRGEGAAAVLVPSAPWAVSAGEVDLVDNAVEPGHRGEIGVYVIGDPGQASLEGGVDADGDR